ncbi:thioredoxin X, chloroplastic, partial [Carica papaya]|uniref:thioredoxin X, chloroplastic n=1 Tax=Carica papaya TaxID=3649 RepID=UPI000B8C8265
MDAVLCNSSPLFGSLHRPAPSVSNRLWFPDPPSASTSRLLFKSSFLTQRKPPRSSSLTHSAIDRLTIKCGAIKEIKEAEFPTTVLKSERPVLVEFVATWCGPCRLISPAMESIAQ